MGDHYIPQHYLEGFCESSTPKVITRYEKGSRQPLTTQIKNVAQEKGFYSADVEKFLNEEIEGPANAVLNKIRARNSISIEDKFVLSAYMITMLKRVPEAQERIRESAPEIVESVFSKVDSEIVQLINQDPSGSELLEKRLEELRQLKPRFAPNLQQTWYQLIPPHTAPRALATLFSMTWCFYTSDKDSAFLTSDNPVYYHQGLGIGQPQSEVGFPISRDIVMWATWKKDVREGFVQAREAIVRELNRRTVSIATRYVFYGREEEWVANLVNKRRIRLNRIA